MNAADARPGMRVYHEPPNNAPFWRGTVQEDDEHQPIANGLIWVKWDGDAASQLIDADAVDPEQ